MSDSPGALAPVDEVQEHAEMLLSLVEGRIRQIIGDRRRRLAEYVEIESAIQQFFYSTNDDGYILTKQDAPFMCESILLIGNPIGQVINAPFSISIEDLGPGLVVTSGYGPEAWTPSGATPPTGNSITIPIDLFVPAYRRGDNLGAATANTDYWFSLPAQWAIPKGDTLRVRFGPPPVSNPDLAYTPPNVVLGGYKVFQRGGK